MENKYKEILREYNFSMKKSVFTIVMILFILLLLIIVFYYSPRKAEVKLVDAGVFEKLVNNEEVFVLNVHTPYQGEIASTDAIIEDWQNIAMYQDKLPRDKSIPIAVYCRSGRMSADAAQQLRDIGYKEIYDLEGGVNAWKESGMEITENK